MRICLILALFFAQSVLARPLPWKTLPPTPALPTATSSGYAPINKVKIWYAIYGQGEPVLLLHGGLANSNYWGHQIPELAKHYQVIVMDSRGHGRSTRDERPYSYTLMSSDVLALMDYLKIQKASIVGWSDGAIIGLDLAMHHPKRINKLFAFAANSNPEGVNTSVTSSPVFQAYVKRAESEYQQLSKTPTQYPQFMAQINHMWESQPNFTSTQLKSITVPTWIVDGDHDEGIKRENTEYMANTIPTAGLLIQPQVSHFAFIQDPNHFTSDVLHFLQTS